MILYNNNENAWTFKCSGFNCDETIAVASRPALPQFLKKAGWEWIISPEIDCWYISRGGRVFCKKCVAKRKEEKGDAESPSRKSKKKNEE